MPTSQVQSPLSTFSPHHSSRPPVLPPRVAALRTGVKWDFLAFPYGFATRECSPKQHGSGLAFCALPLLSITASFVSAVPAECSCTSFSSLLRLCPTVYSPNTLEEHLGRCQIRGLAESAVVKVLGLVVRPHPMGAGAFGYAWGRAGFSEGVHGLPLGSAQPFPRLWFLSSLQSLRLSVPVALHSCC